MSPSPAKAPPAVPLRRSVGLVGLVLYGLGTTIGAGIYALTGEVAGRAGLLAPLAFGVAALLAGLSAASFAELSARYPRAAGEALYVREGLRSPRIATVVGCLVVLTGCFSAAAVANGFVGYLGALVALPRSIGLALFVAAITGVAFWGIRESVALAALVSGIEIVGLLLVIGAAGGSLAEIPERLPDLLPGAGDLVPLLGAALLTFYAFIGFEDMVNVAEEVRDVRRTLPIAIALVLVLTTALYVLLSLVAVLSVPPAELAASGAPLATVYARSGGSAAWLGVIGVIAMLNGALIQVVKTARVLYGLAGAGSLPAFLARVHPRRRTPAVATVLAGIFVWGLATAFPLAALAEATSVLTLLVFALVNLSLLLIRRREPLPPGVWGAPAVVPAAGTGVCLALFGFEIVRRLAG